MFENQAPFYTIIEVASNNDPEVVPEESERLLEFIDSVNEHIVEGLIPQGEAQAKTIWDCRENLAPAAASYGLPLYYDVSLSSNKFYQCVSELREFVKHTGELSQSERDCIEIHGYGHIGDGNLHINVVIPGHDNHELQGRVKTVVEPFIMKFVKDARGSVSAEHGIGF